MEFLLPEALRVESEGGDTETKVHWIFYCRAKIRKRFKNTDTHTSVTSDRNTFTEETMASDPVRPIRAQQLLATRPPARGDVLTPFGASWVGGAPSRRRSEVLGLQPPPPALHRLLLLQLDLCSRALGRSCREENHTEPPASQLHQHRLRSAEL